MCLSQPANIIKKISVFWFLIPMVLSGEIEFVHSQNATSHYLGFINHCTC